MLYMTSVQNHRLPLSGNKRKLGFFFIAIWLSVSCQVAKPAMGREQKEKEKDTGTVISRDSIPKRNSPHLQPKDSLVSIFPKTIKSKYVISVFLPLYFDSLDREQNQKSALSVSRDFYKGMIIATDSLRSKGANIDIHFFDSEDGWIYQTLRDTLKKNNTDLIIGPILESHLKFMDSLSKTEHINYVSSLLTKEKCNNNEFYFQSIPSPTMEGLAASGLVKKNLKGRKVFIINDRKTEKSQVSDAFIAQFKPDEIKVINCKSKGVAALPNPFPYADSNVIFIPSKSESFVNQVLSKFRVDSQNISFIAPIQWQFFKSFEGDLWEKYHVYALSPYFIDYQNPAINHFIKEYRAKYNEEPSVWAFIGYDELTYYGNLLNKYGKYFQAQVDGTNTTMLHTDYRLRHSRYGCGWQNEYVNTLQFQNYQLNQVVH